MIKVIRQGEGYVPPGFERDLRLISPNFSVIWDKEAQSFLVVSTGPANVFNRVLVAEYAVTGEDGQFVPIDSTVLEAIRELMHEKPKDVSVQNGKQSLGPLMKKIKQRKLERRARAFREFLAMKSDFYKKWNKLWKTKTFT